MEKLVGYYRWGNWVVFLGNGKTLVVTKPKNLVIKTLEDADLLKGTDLLMFKDEGKELIKIFGPKDQIERLVIFLGGVLV